MEEVDTTQQSTQDSNNQETTETPFYYAEGIAGEGIAPEWFKGDKYKTVAAQAEAYTALEGKFGSFTGSPDEFEINLSEELTKQGIEIDKDDPLMEEAIKFAKDRDMNQEGFNELLNIYAMSKISDGEIAEEARVNEMKALGDQGQARIDNLVAWGGKNLSEDQFEGFQDMATTAKAVEALEQLVSMTRGAPLNPSEAGAAPGITATELKTLQFAKDEYGNRKMATDPAYRKEVEQKFNEFHGTEPQTQIIGA